MIANRSLSGLIQRIKRDQSYTVNGEYSSWDVYGILSEKGSCLLRGIIFSAFSPGSGIVFMGKRVCVDNRRRIRRMGTLVIGDDVRILAISKEGIMFGKNVSIGPKSILQCTGILRNQGCGIVIGDNTGIGPMAYIGGQGGVRIGNDVIVGPGLRIFSENHNYTDADTIIRNQGERRACVRIGDNCWIGANVVITAGVEIGNGCVIGAGAVVTRSIEPNSVAVGNPARKIKSRTRNDQ